MPAIKSSAELRNNYNETYEEMNSRFELYSLVKDGQVMRLPFLIS